MPAENQPSSRKPVVYRRATPPPPIVAYEDVTAACGHPEKFGLFDDRLDRFRRDRRKKVTDRPCRACRERKQQEADEAVKTRRAERQKRSEAAAAAGSEKKPSGYSATERLPDGAKVEAAYEAALTRWTGTLTVGDAVFGGTAGGLFKLLKQLDQKYRQSLASTSTVRTDREIDAAASFSSRRTESP
jgi:hypothetical protein